jgi:uncharacterized protein YaiE (UPF0345 family)
LKVNLTLGSSRSIVNFKISRSTSTMEVQGQLHHWKFMTSTERFKVNITTEFHLQNLQKVIYSDEDFG